MRVIVFILLKTSHIIQKNVENVVTINVQNVKNGTQEESMIKLTLIALKNVLLVEYQFLNQKDVITCNVLFVKSISVIYVICSAEKKS